MHAVTSFWHFNRKIRSTSFTNTVRLSNSSNKSSTAWYQQPRETGSVFTSCYNFSHIWPINKGMNTCNSYKLSHRGPLIDSHREVNHKFCLCMQKSQVDESSIGTELLLKDRIHLLSAILTLSVFWPVVFQLSLYIIRQSMKISKGEKKIRG